MSDSEDSTVTYTQVSSPFEDSSDVGSPGVDGPPVMPEDPYAYIVAAYQAPPSPDYMPGPEEPQSPPPLDFVPEPMYPEYMPLEDEILPAEEQPLPAAASPTADSPGYVPESDPEEEPEADDDEDPEEDPADYPADQDDDEEEEEPSGDVADDEEEEHPAPADSVPPVHRMTAMISIRDEPSISLPPRERASPPASPIRPLGYRAAMIWLRAETPSTSHLLPLPTSSPPFSATAPLDRLEGRQADYGFVGTYGYEIRWTGAEEVGFTGIRDVWVDSREAIEEVASMTLEGVNSRVTKLTVVQEQDRELSML
ncbi:hypothetical protein Tco_1113433 [Tanacetum coccineum]|uniref:Uncharacterized protein n=1 Tax=Tanacetum coccineum TaxID=301880 RepID=A0ABQ5ITP9_9ASTR